MSKDVVGDREGGGEGRWSVPPDGEVPDVRGVMGRCLGPSQTCAGE